MLQFLLRPIFAGAEGSLAIALPVAAAAASAAPPPSSALAGLALAERAAFLAWLRLAEAPFVG